MKNASVEAGATIMKTKSSKARAGAMFMKIIHNGSAAPVISHALHDFHMVSTSD